MTPVHPKTTIHNTLVSTLKVSPAMAQEPHSSSEKTPVDVADERSKIAEWLASEGFRPSIEEGLIVFKYEAYRFTISYDPDQSPHTLMLACGCMRLDTIPVEVYLVAANRVNSEVYAAKAFVAETEITFSIESLLSDPGRDFPILALELLALIKRSVGVFFAVIEEINSDSSD